MNRFVLATLLCTIGHCALGADTDGDGLLDLIDVPGFEANASGQLQFFSKGIQDLDGARLLTNARVLNLNGNQIRSIEQQDFEGLSNLLELHIGGNLIASLENASASSFRRPN
jgi:Leucine-rich repeat (LRR) protein